MARPDTNQLKTLLDPAKTVHLLLPQNPPYDAVASSLALKLTLESHQKTVVIACPEPMTVEFNRLVGVDTITTNFGSRNLVISFPDQTEHVDKVSYNLENGQLQLVISPKSGSPDLDHRRLKFTSSAGKSDISLLIGVHQLSDLGKFYSDAKDYFSNAQLVSLTLDLPGQNYTPHQVYDPDASSLSELIAGLIDALNLSLGSDAASNLLAGLKAATQNFQSPAVGPDTFEIAARLLRRGARHHDVYEPKDLPAGSVPQAPAPQSPVPSTAAGYGTDSQKDPEPVKDAPSPDWYEPKIYSGSMLP